MADHGEISHGHGHDDRPRGRQTQEAARLVDGGVDAEPEPVEGEQMADVDAELGMAAQVPGVQVVEVNVQQAQGPGRSCAHVSPFGPEMA